MMSGRIPVASILHPATAYIAISVGRIPLQSGLKSLVVALLIFLAKSDI
ncbi:hypothetical protein [Psychrobacter sp. M13]|nr:hypothetical protein [Psychrobacter sp. M13]WLP93447.1 hypothetical protein Q9G97_07475 [Psychrobacter sp. M13]